MPTGFVYAAVAEGAAGALRDLITDFTKGEDKIDLQRIDALPADPLADTLRFLGRGGFDNQAGALTFRYGHQRTVVSADLNGDGVADFQIDLAGRIALTAGDFIL